MVGASRTPLALVFLAYSSYLLPGASLHVRMADEAVALDESGAQAYLNRCVPQIEQIVRVTNTEHSRNIVDICIARNINVVIPGYGMDTRVSACCVLSDLNFNRLLEREQPVC